MCSRERVRQCVYVRVRVCAFAFANCLPIYTHAHTHSVGNMSVINTYTRTHAHHTLTLRPVCAPHVARLAGENTEHTARCWLTTNSFTIRASCQKYSNVCARMRVWGHTPRGHAGNIPRMPVQPDGRPLVDCLCMCMRDVTLRRGHTLTHAQRPHNTARTAKATYRRI